MDSDKEILKVLKSIDRRLADIQRHLKPEKPVIVETRAPPKTFGR